MGDVLAAVGRCFSFRADVADPLQDFGARHGFKGRVLVRVVLEQGQDPLPCRVHAVDVP